MLVHGCPIDPYLEQCLSKQKGCIKQSNFKRMADHARTHICHDAIVDVVGLPGSVSVPVVVTAVPMLDRHGPATTISVFLPAHDFLWTFTVCFCKFFVRSGDPVEAVLWYTPTSLEIAFTCEHLHVCTRHLLSLSDKEKVYSTVGGKLHDQSVYESA